MALFKSNAPEPQQPAQPEVDPSARGPQKKAAPTPSRKAAEAARRERLNPTLSPKQARVRQRATQTANRDRAFQDLEGSPQRQLMRDVVDSRFNIAEFAMPILLVIMASMFLPNAEAWISWGLYLTWAYFALIIFDAFLVWRKFKGLATQRGLPTKGMAFYGFNRTLSFRRWRQPSPRLKRGDPIP